MSSDVSHPFSIPCKAFATRWKAYCMRVYNYQRPDFATAFSTLTYDEETFKVPIQTFCGRRAASFSLHGNV